jgi:hypothetical protein
MGLSAFGTAAERLPSELVESLEEQGPVHRLVAAWLHLKAAQNQCLWGKVDQVEAEIKSIVAPLPETMLAAISELLVMLRIEIAFSRAMHERSVEPIRGIRFGKGVDWLAPHLRPRFAALDAALAGDSANSARFLNQALRYAEASPDMALRESESRMAEAIRALRPA